MGFEIFEKNMLAYRDRYGLILSGNKEDTSSLEVGIEIIEGKKILYVNLGEEFYQLDSLYDSQELLSMWIKGFANLSFASKLLMFGLGNGMFVRKFLEEIPDTLGIVIYEPSSIMFRQIMENFDISDIILDPRVTIFIEGIKTTEYERHLIEELNEEDIPICMISTYPNYPNIFKEEYSHNQAQIRYVMVMVASEVKFQKMMAGVFYRNTMANIPFITKSKSLLDLKNRLPQELSAIIVGTGPSLDKNIEFLNKAKGKALIIAVDSSLPSLLKRNIIPDMFVTVDASKDSGHFVDERVREIPLVGNLVIKPEILNTHKSVCFFIDNSNNHIAEKIQSFNKDLVALESGGSVAHSAYSLAKWLGCKNIILVGQDLAYLDGKSHAATSVRGIAKNDLNGQERIMVPSVYGGTVETSSNMYLYLQWFIRVIKEEQDITVIDATEGGARIEGTILMTLEEAISKCCNKQIDLKGIFCEVENYLSIQEQEDFVKEIQQLPYRLKDLDSLIRKGMRTYEKITELIYQNKYHSQEMLRLFKSVSVVTSALENSAEMIYVNWVMTGIINNEADNIIEDIYVINKSEKDDLIQTVETAVRYLKALQKAINFVVDDIPIHLLKNL